MVYVTHRMHEIFRICDTATVMRSGETVVSGKCPTFLDDIVFYMTGKRPKRSEQAHEVAEHYDERELIVDVRKLAIEPKVKDVSLKAYCGEIIGIGGLEGQGQPEVIRAILGEIRPQNGTITYMGKDVHFRDPADGVKAGIGFISGERNVKRCSPSGPSAKTFLPETRRKTSFFPTFARPLCGGFQRTPSKLTTSRSATQGPGELAFRRESAETRYCALDAMNPNLLLLDDPTKGVDILSRREIHEILHKCTENGMTVIISASDSDELLEISDRIYVFYEGRISDMLVGPTKTPERLVAAMMGMNAKKEAHADEQVCRCSAQIPRAAFLYRAYAVFERGGPQHRRSGHFDLYDGRYTFGNFFAFFSPTSLNTIIMTNLPFILVTVGQAILLIVGQMDISIGIQIALVNVVCIMVPQELGTSVWVGWAAGIGAAIAISLVAGFACSVLRLPALLASYA
jgi:ABC-type multidrug transport system ATPase subunit